MLEKQFVTYDIALKLKELGYNGTCFAAFVDIDKPVLEIGGIWKHEPCDEITKSPL